MVQLLSGSAENTHLGGLVSLKSFVLILLEDNAAHVGHEVRHKQKRRRYLLDYVVCLWLLSGCGCRLLMSKSSDWRRAGWSASRFGLRIAGVLPRITRVRCGTTVSHFHEQRSFTAAFFPFFFDFILPFCLFALTVLGVEG